MANIWIRTAGDKFVILQESNWECKVFAHFAKTLDSNNCPYHHQYGTQEAHGWKKNSARVLIWQQEYEDVLGDCRFWGSCCQDNCQLYGCVYPGDVLQKVIRIKMPWSTVATAQLTCTIAAADCISKILSSAINRCSFGVAGVGEFAVMCVPNAKRMMKGVLVNDSIIMASERLVRAMQKLTSYLVSFLSIYCRKLESGFFYFFAGTSPVGSWTYFNVSALFPKLLIWCRSIRS